MMCPGTPTTVESSGTLRSTTEPAPIRQLLPTVMLPRIFAPAANHHVVEQRRMALAVLLAGSAERHALVERDVVADDGGLANHHAHAVIDKQAPADLRARDEFQFR